MLETIHEYALERWPPAVRPGRCSRVTPPTFWRWPSRGNQAERRAARVARAADAEYDNLHAPSRAAWIRRPIRTPPRAQRSGCGWRFPWGATGDGVRFAEGRRRLEAGLAVTPEAPAVFRARALFEIGWLAHSQGNYHEAVNRYEACLVLYRELGDAQGVAHALFLKGTALGRATGDYSQRAELQAHGLELARKLGDTWQTASFASTLGRTLYDLGEVERAVALLEEGLTLFRATPGSPDMIGPLLSLSNIARARGEYDRALALLEESDAVWRAFGEPPPTTPSCAAAVFWPWRG